MAFVSLEDKKTVIRLRWLEIIATSYLMISAQSTPLFFQKFNVLIFIFILSNIFLYFSPAAVFKLPIFNTSIFVADIAIISLGIYLSQNFANEFFLIYFLVIAVAAAGQNIKGSISAAIIASLFYLFMLSKKSEPFNLYDINLYIKIPFLFTVSLFVSYLSQKVKTEHSLAITDRLTGLHNYGYFQEQLDEEIKSSKEDKREFALVMLDLDNFKKYNDTYGHLQGNIYLKNIANSIKEVVGPDKLLARYGGDEFVVLLSDDNTGKLIERIKISVDNTEPPESTEKIKATVSVGVAIFPKDAKTGDELFDKADQALYRAKNAGKNRIAYL
ncbi:MAG: GGDEF domain-containing protein [Candidatus Firestonebacteria bacterium]